jgi:hypothetical protein
VPFKSKKQRTYLAINEPDVYKKFKKEETMMYGKPIKKAKGGAAKARKKSRKAAPKPIGTLKQGKAKLAGAQMAGGTPKTKPQKRTEEMARMLGRVSSDIKRMEDKKKRDKFGIGLPDYRRTDPLNKVPNPSGKFLNKRPMGGKVYKVDNSGQDLVQKMYGGKIKK